VMAVTEVPTGIQQKPTVEDSRIHVRPVMKRKLLLAVVWIALGGGIVALIIFPAKSVLTAEFRH
jgi:hypothetical protein